MSLQRTSPTPTPPGRRTARALTAGRWWSFRRRPGGTPSGPLWRADENGYLEMPNVDMVKEITDAMAATQAYSANVTMMNTLKAVVSKGMEIGR